MRHITIWLAVVGLILVPALPAGADGESVTIKITIDDRAQLEELSRLVSIDDVRGLEVFAEATPRQLQRIAAAGFSWQELPKAAPVLATMCPAGWVDDSSRPWDCYPSYPQYAALMQKFAGDHPDLCSLLDLGATTNLVRPHRLWLLKISDNPGVEENEPELLYTSTMHGDETTGYVLMLRLIDELLSNYGSDPELTALVDDLEIWINPAHNPDGTYRTSDTTVDGAIRSYTTTSGANSGVDPNRNFPDPDEGPHPDGNPWWAETQLMMAFAEDHSISLSANFHGGVEVVNYPWDTWARRHVDDAWFIHISRMYADNAQAASPPGYMTGFNNGITNGWDWYPVAGGRQDFMTFFHGGREVTIEISDTKLLPASQLDDHWDWNRQALLDYMKQARYGIHGLVTGSGGLPLEATIEIVGLDLAMDNSYVLTDPDVGDYHRLLLPGTYTVRVRADGFAPQQLANVVVEEGEAEVVDFVLHQAGPVTVSGEITTPATEIPIEGATVELVDSPYGPVTTGADGSYSILGVMEALYTFRVSADGFETIAVERIVALPHTELHFALAPLSYSFYTDLEASNGGLQGSGGWEWGEPSGSGSPAAHSGDRVWATDLDGPYGHGAHWYLDLDDVSIPSDDARLSFWHWYEIEPGYDGGNLSVRPTGGGGYQLVTPDSGYPDDDVTALGQAGYTGSSGGWSEARFDLAGWAGQAVDLRWHFASDSTVNDLGWYLDDIAVGSLDHGAGFDFDPPTAGVGEQVQFTDRSTGPVLWWWWDFGDGATSGEQNPSHGWSSEGSWPVTLTVFYPIGSDSHTQTVEVGDVASIFADGFESGDTSLWSLTVD